MNRYIVSIFFVTFLVAVTPQCMRGEDLSPLDDDIEEDENYQCWWSPCFPRNSSTFNCPTGFHLKSSQECDTGENSFECCGNTQELIEEDETMLTGEAYEDLVKSLLLEDEEYIQPADLRCDMIDPGKNQMLKVNDDAIRICDMCPLLPQKYLANVYLDRVPKYNLSTLLLGDCFGLCVRDKTCMAVSYDQNSTTCYFFDSTAGGYESDQGWITVLMTQPSGIVRDWSYTRHTRLLGRPMDSSKQPSFLHCLDDCDQKLGCNYASYSTTTSNCSLFANDDDLVSSDLVYGHLAGFRVSESTSSLTPDERFILEGEELTLKNVSKTDEKCKHLDNSTYGAYFSQSCLVRGSSIAGCELETGCKICYYPERTEEFEKLPICPDSEFERLNTLKASILAKMQNCLDESTCIGVGYNADTEEISTIDIQDFVQREYTTRYRLNNPPNDSRQYLQHYDLVARADIKSISTSNEDFEEITAKNFQHCIDMFNQNKFTRMSYSLQSGICKFGTEKTAFITSGKDEYISVFKRPSLLSPALNYLRIPGFSIVSGTPHATTENCVGNCEDECSKQCSQEHGEWCVYISLQQNPNGARCQFYDSDSEFESEYEETSVVMTKISSFNFSLQSFDKLDAFQSSNMYNCFNQKNTQTQTSLTNYQEINTEVTYFRETRGLFSLFTGFWKSIVESAKKVVNAIVDTGKGIVKTVKNLVKGDFKAAGESFVDIPVIDLMVDTGELTAAVFTGDWETAQSKGLEILESDAFELVTSVGMFGPGSLIASGAKVGIKGVSRVASIAMKQAAKSAAKQSAKQASKHVAKTVTNQLKKKLKDIGKDEIKKKLEDMGKDGLKKIVKPGKKKWSKRPPGKGPKKVHKPKAVKPPKGPPGKGPKPGDKPGKKKPPKGPPGKGRKPGDKPEKEKPPKGPPGKGPKPGDKPGKKKPPKGPPGKGRKPGDKPEKEKPPKGPPGKGPKPGDKPGKKKPPKGSPGKGRKPGDKPEKEKPPKGPPGKGPKPGDKPGKKKPPKGPPGKGRKPGDKPEKEKPPKGPPGKGPKPGDKPGKKKPPKGPPGKGRKPGDKPEKEKPPKGPPGKGPKPGDKPGKKKPPKGPPGKGRKPGDKPEKEKPPKNEVKPDSDKMPEVAPVEVPKEEENPDFGGEQQVFGIGMDVVNKGLEELDTLLNKSVPAVNDSRRMENKYLLNLHGLFVPYSDQADVFDDTVIAQSCAKRIVGYYTSWGKKTIAGLELQRLTHVIYAFLEMHPDGRISIGSEDSTNPKDVEMTEKTRMRLENLMESAQRYPHLKVMFAVGGWENSQYFSAVAASPGMRVTFIASVIRMIDEWGFDGVDIVWEYPVTGGADEGVPADKQNYVVLMKELRTALDALADRVGRKDKFLISFAGATGQWTLDPGYDLPGLFKYTDFVNIMTYDYFGAWASKQGAYTGPPSPLYFGMPPGFSGKTNTDWSVQYYACKTQQPHKINMGVPFYGRYWGNVGGSVDGKDEMWRTVSSKNGKSVGGYVPWYKIKTNYVDNDAFEKKFHERAKTPYAWNPSKKIFLGYENEKSLEYKVNYATDKNIGGLTIWAVDWDDNDLTLLNTIAKAPLCQKTDPKDVNYKCSPIVDKRWWTPEDGDDKAGSCGRSAPLYKGFFPVCDPEDPGYGCCGPSGRCGSGTEFCDCLVCKNYRENPQAILEEPTKPPSNLSQLVWAN